MSVQATKFSVINSRARPPALVNVIGESETEAFSKACELLGNRITVDRLKVLGYKSIKVSITEISD